MSLDMRELVALIPEWLAVTRGRAVSTGLSREEALRRAAALRGLLRDGKVDPENVVLDEELKDVFYGLVALVTDVEPLEGAALAEEANSIYKFLARVEWADDNFEEKSGLLTALASAGWRALGSSLAEIQMCREAGSPRPSGTIQNYKTDPDELLSSGSLLRWPASSQRTSNFLSAEIASMSETARLLRFPERRRNVFIDTEEAERRVESFLQIDVADLNGDALSVLADGEVLSALCRRLRQDWNAEPAAAAARATLAYRWLSGSGRKCGLFDEHDYFVGKFSLLAAGGYRIIGDGENAERWLGRAESGFRHTVNPGPMLAEIAYMRLALAYDRRQYEDVLDLLPSTARSFERLGMARELAKTCFLRAMTLKESGKRAEALDAFRILDSSLTENALDSALLGRVCIEMGALQAGDGLWEIATGSYRRAISLLAKSGNPDALAHLRMTLGENLRNQSRFDEAAVAFREGIAAYAALGMATYVAYGRVVLAEDLLLLDRPREAEWEILQALPTIEEQKMVPEGFAAVALLRESVKRRKADPNALRELREHLQKQN